MRLPAERFCNAGKVQAELLIWKMAEVFRICIGWLQLK
jgi:hypothetical protein